MNTSMSKNYYPDNNITNKNFIQSKGVYFMEAKQKFMAVFSLRMAGYLMMNGFVLMNMKDHYDGSGKKVYYFINSPELVKVMNEYKELSKNN